MFNSLGVSLVTTNHIAAKVGISPGNLYYHFANKEEIIRILFNQMTDQVETAWVKPLPTEAFFQASFDIFWDYRFLHREFYMLRRGDPKLLRLWRTHISNCRRLLRGQVSEWVSSGQIRSLSPSEAEFLMTAILQSSSSFLQIYESSLRQPSRGRLQEAVNFCLQLVSLFKQPSRL